MNSKLLLCVALCSALMACNPSDNSSSDADTSPILTGPDATQVADENKPTHSGVVTGLAVINKANSMYVKWLPFTEASSYQLMVESDYGDQTIGTGSDFSYELDVEQGVKYSFSVLALDVDGNRVASSVTISSTVDVNAVKFLDTAP